jgi:hypothetical protein
MTLIPGLEYQGTHKKTTEMSDELEMVEMALQGDATFTAEENKGEEVLKYNMRNEIAR